MLVPLLAVQPKPNGHKQGLKVWALLVILLECSQGRLTSTGCHVREPLAASSEKDDT